MRPPRVLKLASSIPVNRLAPGGTAYTHEVVWTTSDGKRHRRRFRSRLLAVTEADKLRARLFSGGDGAMALRPGDAEALAEARALLEPWGGDLLAVVREWAARKRQEAASLALEDAAKVFLDAKERDGLRPRSLRALRGALGRFATAFPGKLLASFGPKDLEDWLARLAVGPLRKRGMRTMLGTFFAFAARRGWCGKGVLEDVPAPKARPGRTEVFSVEEARALLNAATQVAPALVPYLALGLFCGLRTAELDRLDWRHVGEAEVRIEAATAKTASRRVVPIPANAAEWLAHHRRKTGPVRPQNARRMLARVCKAASVEWKPNAMRHSFASYRLAACNDAPRVSLELGHTSPGLVFRHYRALVSEADAKRYFALAPAT